MKVHKELGLNVLMVQEDLKTRIKIDVENLTLSQKEVT